MKKLIQYTDKEGVQKSERKPRYTAVRERFLLSLSSVFSIILALVIMLLCLTGCSDDDSGQAQISQQAGQVESVVADAPERIFLEVSSGVIVDAQVVIPDTYQYGAFLAEYPQISSEYIEKAKSLLINDPDPSLTVSGDIYSYDAGSKYLGICSRFLAYEDTDFSNLILNIFLPPTRKGATNAERFADCDLSFCSQEQAVADTVDILAQLDISVAGQPRVFSLSQKDLQSAKELYTVDNSFYPFDTSLYPDNIDLSYECYYIKFNAQYEQIPLYNELFIYKTIPDFAIEHPEINVIYSAQGIKYISVSGYRPALSNAQAVNHIVEPQAAAQAICDKYADVVSKDRIVFDRIELMYVYTPAPGYTHGSDEEQLVQMHPAWVCTGSVTSTQTGGRGEAERIAAERIAILIDAQTGREII